MNINRVKLQHDSELIMFRFYFPLFVFFCYVIFTHGFLSTPACDVLLHVRDEPRGKNIAQSFLFTAKSRTK